MEQFLEKVMNFINENTMLLIIICIFLIVILVIYLIDNTIKTKRLEQEEAEKKANPEEPTIIDNPIPEKVEAPVVEETKVVESVAPVVPEEPVVEEPVEETIPEPVVEETPIEEPTAPVEVPTSDFNIDELLNKDYSTNNEVVENIPEEPTVPVEPVVEAPKSKYSNDKKLSDIFGKKSKNKLETTQDFSDELKRVLEKMNNGDSYNKKIEAVETTKKIETTQDFSDELDRILQKLNSEESTNEDESTDYTNMF